jgi:hypothetical protein
MSIPYQDTEGIEGEGGSNMKRIQVGKAKIYMPEVINGLASEAKKIRKAYSKINPSAVAMQISEEEMKGLKKIVEGEEFEYFMSNYEQIYAKKLAQFGEVKVPPPNYEAGLELCLENEIPAIPIDMDDMLFADVFCENISGWQLYRHSLRVKRLRKKRFRAKTPKEFVMEWDREINKLKGFRNLELAREDYMAKELLRLAKEHERILCIIELQRVEGVSKKISESQKKEKIEDNGD